MKRYQGTKMIHKNKNSLMNNAYHNFRFIVIKSEAREFFCIINDTDKNILEFLIDILLRGKFIFLKLAL